jgi:hypothetical protein
LIAQSGSCLDRAVGGAAAHAFMALVEIPSDPAVIALTEQVVERVRDFHRRLGWIRDPASLDDIVRWTVLYQLGWVYEENPDDWVSRGLSAVAIRLQAELAEETTEPWPRQAKNYPPGGRDATSPHVEIRDGFTYLSWTDRSGEDFSLEPVKV